MKDDSRIKALENLNSSKVDELYYFEKLPIKFKRYNIAEPIKNGNGFIIHEIWDKGPENLQTIIFSTFFSDTEEVALNADFINAKEIKEVKGVKGYYSIEESQGDSSNSLFEKVTFGLEGVKYEITFMQYVKKEGVEIQPFGSEYIVNMLNEYLVRK
ncbi:hypothetical protein P9B03_13835 [Metasolibacillus meyeri]|uniref:Uncharacterized protein n=1 Tax=Metasolibacillus meyeri TaxID=1071052 RepID=A0AAW9NXP1_9BACL|nr:hypothetical protein [Metasolibacillus meyeri]MEC1179575.1 hypothetical protein [Metasolibacillus meyeri]